jgi:hypothetical protein
MASVSSYQEAKVRGQAMLQKLHRVLHSNWKGPVPTIPDFDKYYHTQKSPRTARVSSTTATTTRVTKAPMMTVASIITKL